MSEVWKYFSVDASDCHFAICSLCTRRISRGPGRSFTTSALWKHFRSHSNDEISNFLEQAEQNLNEPDVTCDSSNTDESLPSSCSNDITLSPSSDQASTSTSCSTPSMSAKVPRLSYTALPRGKPKYYSLGLFKKGNPKQATIHDCFEKKKIFDVGHSRRLRITGLIAEMICLDFQPLSIVENVGFKKLIEYLEPRYPMVTRKQLANVVIPDMFRRVQGEVKNLLLSADSKVCITTDMWSSIANNDYISITCNFITNDFKLKHATLEVLPYPEVSHTAESIRAILLKILSDWGIKNKVACVIHDNAANMVAALNESGLTHLSCFAHSLQLVVLAGVKEKALSNILALCRKLVGHFKHSTKACKMLKAAQIASSVPEHRLIQDEPTRWDSTYLMISRLVEQRYALKYLVEELNYSLPVEINSQQWKQLSDLCQILKCFYDATKTISKNETTASEAIPIYLSIKNTLSSVGNDLGSSVTIAKNEILSQMKRRFANMERQKNYVLATLLDPRFKDRIFIDKVAAKQMLIEELQTIGRKGTPVHEMSDNQPPSLPKGEEEKCTMYGNIFPDVEDSVTMGEDTFEQEVNSYLMEKRLNIEENVMCYWKYNIKYERLKRLCREYLCVCPSSVESERVFSTAGTIVDKRRNRLDPERVRMLVFLNKNLGANEQV